MKPISRSPGWMYGLAVVASVLAVVFELLVPTGLAGPFILSAGVMFFCASYAGLGPGIVASIILFAAGVDQTLGPGLPLRVPGFEEAVRLLLFAAAALLIVWLTLRRERIERQVIQQNKLLRFTLSSIGDGVIATDGGGRVSFMNPAAESLTGRKPDAVVGQALGDVFAVIDEQSGAAVHNPIARVIAEDAAVALENHSLLVAADGGRIPVEASAAPIRDEKGRRVGVVSVFRDITERRRAEAALQASEERYRVVTEGASDAIITIDHADRMLFVNRAAEKIFGYPRVEMIGRDLVMLMRTDQREVHRAAMQRYLETGEPQRAWEGIELVGLRGDGQTIPLEVSFGKFVREGQTYFTGILRDITERKQAEKRQEAQVAVTRALVESDTLGEAAPRILQAVCESVGWQVGALWTIDPHVELLRCVDVWRLPEAPLDEFEALTRELLVSYGLDLPGRVWSSASPCWISDVASDPNFPRSKVAAMNDLHGAFGFPIASGDKVIGVVEFFSQAVRPPDDALIEMLSALGSQIGLFVERKRAEEELKLSKEQQAIILRGVTDGITAQDAKGRVIYANDAAARLLGYASPQELLETPPARVMERFQVLDEGGQPQPQVPLPGRLALKGEEPAPATIRFRNHPGGEPRWSLVSATPVRDEEGLVQFAVSIFRDVTELRHAEEELARLAAIVTYSEDAIVSKTVDGIILTWNPGATRLYGYDADEALGRSIAMLYPPDRMGEFQESRERLRRGEPTPLHDTVRLTKDGRRIDLSVSTSVIKNSAGQVIGGSTIGRDITQRKQSEQAQHFLAEASKALASSLDLQETLSAVARLAVPQIADWCAVDILEDGGAPRRIAVVHADPDKVRQAEELQRRYPPDPAAPVGLYHVLATGRPELVSTITEEQIAAAARDVEHLKRLVDLGLRSYIVAPLTARGRTLGAITLAAAESDRRYGEAELALAEELAYRAALAVDNARLYRDQQKLNEELEQRVVSRTIELQNTNRKLETEVSQRERATQRLRELSAHLQSAREDERIRIAREIHDELGQVLTAIKIDVSLLGQKLADKTERLERGALVEELNSTIKLIDETIEKMRRIIRELRPEILDHLGLGAAIEWQLQEFQSRTGIDCQFESSVDDGRIGLDRSTAVFRILQEALTNVARHAQATRIWVRLRQEQNLLTLEIRDNGRGFDGADLSGRKSFGILGMRERALAFNGDVAVSGAPGDGTIVTARIPV